MEVVKKHKYKNTKCENFYVQIFQIRLIDFLMIKAIIFDLDGVLIESKDLHFLALNKALNKIDKKFQITFDEHLSKYDEFIN